MRFVLTLGFLALSLGVAACNQSPSGVACSASGRCADGYYCNSSDNVCYLNCTGPSPDPSCFDGGGVTPTSVPPRAVWISSGGGSASAMSGNQIGISIGGSVLVGQSKGAGGEQVTWGPFSTSSY
jgi:hypothetical protein